jgi:hypothetical protein
MSPLTYEEALFSPASEKKLFVLCLQENERPLRGANGLLDWRFRGLISNWIIAGKITGRKNEKVYLPLHTRHGLRHAVVIGLGTEKDPTDVPSVVSAVTKSLKFSNVVFHSSARSLVKGSLSGAEVLE